MIGTIAQKVSCLIVTCDGRSGHVMNAIKYYRNQTYPNKELVIVSQAADNSAIENSIQDQKDVIFQAAPKDLTLGAMRNLSVELSTGDIMCQWDDDDFHGPKRIAVQYNALLQHSNSTASCFSQFLKFFKNSNRLYWCDWEIQTHTSHRYLCGAIMFRKKYFHEYGSLLYPEFGGQSGKEEDLHVVHKLLFKGPIIPVRDAMEYAYVYHGSNTYDLAHHELTLNTTWGRNVMDRSFLEAHRDQIENVLNTWDDKEIEVSDLDGVAFKYIKE